MRLRKLLCAMTASAVLLRGTFPAAAYEGRDADTGNREHSGKL